LKGRHDRAQVERRGEELPVVEDREAIVLEALPHHHHEREEEEEKRPGHRGPEQEDREQRGARCAGGGRRGGAGAPGGARLGGLSRRGHQSAASVVVAGRILVADRGQSTVTASPGANSAPRRPATLAVSVPPLTATTSLIASPR